MLLTIVLLSSVAATFSSTRYTANGPGLYKTLMSIQTMATDDISSILSLSQDGKAIEVESRAGDVHIDEHDGGVTLYVPRNKRKQEFCFASPLPISLADWLMRDPTTHIQGGVDAAMVTALITLLAVAPSAVDLILDHQGIVQVPIPNEDIRSSSDDDVSDSDSEEAGDDTAVVRYTPPAEDHSPPMENGVVEVYSEQARVGYGAHGGYSASRLLPHPAHPDEDDRQYLELLNKVVRTASYAQFPSKGPFDMSSLQSVLSGDAVVGYNGYESWNRFRPNNLAERNFRVGAAGELYVSYTEYESANMDADRSTGFRSLEQTKSSSTWMEPRQLEEQHPRPRRNPRSLQGLGSLGWVRDRGPRLR